MINHAKMAACIVVLSSLSACTANSKSYPLSEAQALNNRAYTTQLQQKDRDIDHKERLRQADAIAKATRNAKGDVIIMPNMLNLHK